MDARHFRRFVVRPTLEHLGLYSLAAENLLVGTAACESGLAWLKQGLRRAGDGEGRALGVYQMEPATHDDIERRWLRFRRALAARVAALAAPAPLPRARQLMTNLAYATAMARLHYRRVRAPLPAADDIAALAGYWKAHWNTLAGAGAPAQFIESYRRLAA